MWLIGAYVVFTGVHAIGLSLDPFVLSVFLAGVDRHVMFCSIAASVIGIDSAGAFVNYVVVGFVWKTAMEVLLLPVTYPTIAAVRRAEERAAA